MKTFSFNVIVEIQDKTGRIISVYFQIRRGRVAKTTEYADGNAFANYDRNGHLLGVELLAPCEITVLDTITVGEPKVAKEFIRNKIPREMVLGECA